MSTVLIADSHARLAEIMAQLLADEPGFDVLPVVDTASDTLAVVQAHRPDVVLVSERLGADAGVAVCAAVRAATSTTTVLVWSHQPERVEAGQPDVDGVLERGMTFRELVRAIRAACKRAEAGREDSAPAAPAGETGRPETLLRTGAPEAARLVHGLPLRLPGGP